MERRTFLVAFLAAYGCGSDDAPKKGVPNTARALPAGKPEATGTPSETRIPRVAMLSFGPREQPSVSTTEAAALLRARLTELGYVQGETIVIEERYADGNAERLKQLAREAVDSKPDVIVTVAVAATAAAREATSTIPIVMLHAGNPVGSGLVASLAHPGGNVTGTTSMIPDLGAKQVELLGQLIPGLATLGVLVNPTNAATAPLLANVTESARTRNVRVVVTQVTRAEEFDKAFGVLRDAHPDALYVMMEPLMGANRERILQFAAANRMPASYDVGAEFVRQGGLISYGPVLRDHYARGADYVDKILKGAKPGDLPVLQPTQFALVINMKTATALGLTVPQSLLLRADEVIQ
jgi:putative ABC transport system substrate-binding protein